MKTKITKIVAMITCLIMLFSFSAYAEGVVWENLYESDKTFEKVQQLYLGTNVVNSVCCSFTAEDDGYYALGDWEVYEISDPVVNGRAGGYKETSVLDFNDYISGNCGYDGFIGIKKINAGETVCLYLPNDNDFPVLEEITYLGNSVIIEPYKSDIIFDSEISEYGMFDIPVEVTFGEYYEITAESSESTEETEEPTKTFKELYKYINVYYVDLYDNWTYGHQETKLYVLDEAVDYSFDIVKIDEYIDSVSLSKKNAFINVGWNGLYSDLINRSLPVVVKMADGKSYEGYTRISMDMIGNNLELGNKSVEAIYNSDFTFDSESATVCVYIADKPYYIEIPTYVKKATMISQFRDFMDNSVKIQLRYVFNDLKNGDTESAKIDFDNLIDDLKRFVDFMFKCEFGGEYSEF